MQRPIYRMLAAVAAIWLAACATTTSPPVATDPLPSWNEGAAKSAILSFVADVSDAGGDDFVPVAERIAVFDNDGTLWAEQPLYFQLAFIMDRVRALAPQQPEWQDTQPFKAVLENDMAALAEAGEPGLMQLLTATHGNMTDAEFRDVVRAWLVTARHPRFDMPYTAMVYQPMLELLDYLRANGFQTWIVSGGGIDFMRAWAEASYGIPPEQVIGSSITTRFEMRSDGPVILREPHIDFINDKEGKPIGIQRHIGRRPIAAFGNSDGDLQMLQWTATGAGPSLMVYIHHTDPDREWAYDRSSHIGRLDRGLDEAQTHGWVVADMQRDWKNVFPFEGRD